MGHEHTFARPAARMRRTDVAARRLLPPPADAASRIDSAVSQCGDRTLAREEWTADVQEERTADAHNFPQPAVDGTPTDAAGSRNATDSQRATSRTSRRRATTKSTEELAIRFEVLVAARIHVSDFREQIQIEQEQLSHELVDIVQSQQCIVHDASSHDTIALSDLQLNASRAINTYNARLERIRQLRKHLKDLEQRMAECDADFVVAAEDIAIPRPEGTTTDQDHTSAVLLQSLRADIDIVQERLAKLDYAHHEDEILRDLLLDRGEVLPISDEDFYTAYFTKRAALQDDLERAECAAIEHERTLGMQYTSSDLPDMMRADSQSGRFGHSDKQLGASTSGSDLERPTSMSSRHLNTDAILEGSAYHPLVRQSEATTTQHDDRVHDWIHSVKASREAPGATRRLSI
ncbi:hypothetical protein DOTSEDRAFT_33879 [Dothistroma septosporum NZE10]|uniref:Uncharacterized protein n=1 Tax=Dothistroma septosporum (strain NZE10 / CBS 128990) TaxID=675120 RepID=N1PSF8_DOTSN|nr:hypothetical protein DOTSEDRAFT_33879 [Dothistroma septosporum NZE10]